MKKQNKKVVDLIYLDDNKSESQLKREYQSRINTWIDWLDVKQNDEKQIQEAHIEEQSEFYMVSSVLKHFIGRRLDWILNSVKDPELRTKYLSVLTPFSQQGNIKRFLMHYFQLAEEDSKQARVKFCLFNKSEREIKILWDIYKLTRTIETVTTLKKATYSSRPFPSSFSTSYIQEVLNTLKNVAQLLVKICIKPLYHKSFLDQFPLEVFNADTILKRKEADEYLIPDVVLEKFDYRNYLFYIYFRPSIKAIYQNEELSFQFNYLDYEIIRQEFLIDWLSVRLGNNQKKYEVFENYRYGNKTFNQVIERNPNMELTLLKKLPTYVFNDLISTVNETVDEGDYATINPESEKVGAFAQQFKQFNKALEFAQKSIKKLKRMVLKSKPESIKPFNFPSRITPLDQVKKSSDTPQKVLLSKNEIAFPFFCEQNAMFTKQYAFFQSKLGARYKAFHKLVTIHLISTPKNDLITRRTPRHEWATANIIENPGENGTNSQLLVLGSDVKTKPLSTGYSSSIEEKYAFKPYFVFGSSTKILGLGDPIEERIARGITYQVYDVSNPQVISKALKLMDVVIKRK